MKTLPCIALAALATCWLPLSALATDAEREARWAEQVEANLFDGEMTWLDGDGQRFLGVLTEAAEPRGYVVVVHGTGVHPDWAQVINPLRVGLVEHGWTTLSIQMPILAADVSHDGYQEVFPEVPARLAAAAAHFGDDRPVYLVAHSLGAAMSSWYLSGEPSPPFAGFVGIGMAGDTAYPEADNVRSLAGVKVPVLDLYGEQDFVSVLSTAQARAAAQSGNADYRQQVVGGADHFFDGHDAALVEAVAAWLDGQAPR